MPRLRYKSTGFSKLKKLLKNLDGETTAELKVAVRESAEAIAADARAMAPVLTGRLRDSIAVAVRKDGLSAAIGPGVTSRKAARAVWYAALVEYGTKGYPPKNIPRMSPQPYLMPAFFLNQEKAVARVRAAINSAVRKAAAGAGPDAD